MKTLDRSFFGRMSPWEVQRIAWMSSLSDGQVLRELRSIMFGQNYSWYTISQRLQAKFNDKDLQIEHFEPGNILYEWNVLCDERISWQRHNQPSFKSIRFNRDCLVKLVIIPLQAGLGHDGMEFTSMNLDKNVHRNSYAVDDRNDYGAAYPEEDFRGRDGYFYAEGPQFRLEYIHDRVEY